MTTMLTNKQTNKDGQRTRVMCTAALLLVVVLTVASGVPAASSATLNIVTKVSTKVWQLRSSTVLLILTIDSNCDQQLEHANTVNAPEKKENGEKDTYSICLDLRAQFTASEYVIN